MRKNKKAFLALIGIVATVFLVATITTTYAWFLSRYSHDFTFVLQSRSTIIIKYDSELQYTVGEEPEDNVLVPAAERLMPTMQQTALEPIDMFTAPSKVRSTANTVKFSASGAYWTGEPNAPEEEGGALKVGDFRPELHAFLSSYAETQSLTADNVLDRLSAERTAASKPLTHNDLVTQGEVSFFMVIEYLNKTFLYYDGSFYVSGAQTDSDFTFPSAAESDNTLRYWHTPTQSNATVSGAQIANATHLYLQPNTTFRYTLYVFMAKTDAELAQSVNGERLTFFATLKLL